jgi:membrane-associated protease RseP (regulator of RpoE activity)
VFARAVATGNVTGVVDLVVLALLIVFGFTLVRALRVAIHTARGVRGARFVGVEPEAFEVPATARLALAAAAVGACYALIFVLATGAMLLAPATRPTTVVDVVPGGAAERAGVRDGDRVLRVGGQVIREFGDIGPALAPHAAEPVAIEVDRGGTTVTVTATPDAGKIGVRSVPAPVPSDPVAAVAFGLKFPGVLYAGLVEALMPHTKEVLIGPLGVLAVATSSGSVGSGLGILLLAFAACLCWMLPFIGPFAAWSASRRAGRVAPG